MIASRLSLAASCSRSTRFFNASWTSPIAFLRLYQLPDAPPPPLLPPPKPPNPPPRELPPNPPPPHPPPIPPSIGPIHQPPPPPLRPLAALRPARTIEKIIQMTKSIAHRLIGDECSRSLRCGGAGGWPESDTPRSSAMYFASVHVAVSIAAL